MKKYYIGIAIICLLTLGFAGYVAYVGIDSKQDVQTLKSAREIETKLNSYVQQNQKIPESLDEVGVKDVPSTIKYTKESDTEYSFCMTYKTASGFNDYGLGQSLVGPALTGGVNVYDDPGYYNNQYTPESLYISEAHKKGENCQTIKPYFSNNKYDDFCPPEALCSDNIDPGTNKETTSTDDAERQIDINSLHSQLEYYYGLNGFYPTLANLNDSTWRTANMKGLDNSSLADPTTTGPTADPSFALVAKPKAKAYAYQVTPAGCDNNSEDCIAYTLTATKSDGTTFVKNSLN